MVPTEPDPIVLTLGQPRTAKLSVLSEAFDPAKLVAVPKWRRSHPPFFTVTPAADGLSAELVGFKAGKASLEVVGYPSNDRSVHISVLIPVYVEVAEGAPSGPPSTKAAGLKVELVDPQPPSA